MAIRKNKKFIDPRYFMDEKTERLQEANTSAPLADRFPPNSRVRFVDANKDPDGRVHEIVGTVIAIDPHRGLVKVKWDRTADFIHALGPHRPGLASGPKGTVSFNDPRLLMPIPAQQ